MLGYRYETAQFMIQDRLRDVAQERLARVAAEARRAGARREVPHPRGALRSALEHARLFGHPATLRPHHLSR